MNTNNGAGSGKTLAILGSVAAIVGLVIALFAWLMPFSPVGSSPFVLSPGQSSQSGEKTTPKQPVVTLSTGSGGIESIWFEYTNEPLLSWRDSGMAIHVKFSVANRRNHKCLAVAYFQWADGRYLNDNFDWIYLRDGVVATFDDFTPRDDYVAYDDFRLFIPWPEFGTERSMAGQNNAKFYVVLYDTVTQEYFARSSDVPFTLPG